MRQVLDTDPSRLNVPLAATWGTSVMMVKLTTQELPDFGDKRAIAITTLIAIGAIAGVGHLYLAGWLFSSVGRRFGGKGRAREVRSAIAWGSVVLAAGNLLYSSITWGVGVLAGDGVEAPALVTESAILLAATAVTVWGYVVFCKCLGEAHGFSAWRALGTAVLSGVLVAIVVLLVALAVTGLGAMVA